MANNSRELDFAVDATVNKSTASCAHFVFPLCAVDEASGTDDTGKSTFTYKKIDRAQMLTNDASIVAVPGAPGARSVVSYTAATGIARLDKLVVALNEEQTADWESRGLSSVEQRMVEPTLAQKVIIADEQRLVGMLSSIQGTTNADTALLWNKSTSDPLGDIKREAGLIQVNSGLADDGEAVLRIAFSYADWAALSSNPAIIAMLPADSVGVLTVSAMEQILSAVLYSDMAAGGRSLVQIRVSRVTRNTAAPGQTAAFARVWTGGTIISAAPDIGEDGRVTLEDDCFGKTFVVQENTSEKWRDADRGQNCVKMTRVVGQNIVNLAGGRKLMGYAA